MKKEGSTSSRGSMNLSEENDYKGKDKDEHIALLKKKLQVLKSSYITLRDSKNQALEELELSRKKTDLLQQESEEKEKSLLKLKKENEELQEKLIMERINAEKYKKIKSATGNNLENTVTEGGSVLSTVTGILTFGLLKGGGETSQEDLKKIQNEYLFLKKQNDSLTEKLKKADNELDNLRKDSCFEVEMLKNKLERFERDLSEKDQQIKNLTNDYRNSCQANIVLMEEKEEFDNEYKTLRAEIEQLHQEKLDVNLQLNQKIKDLRDFESSKNMSQKDVFQLEEEIFRLNTRLQEVESQMKIFKIFKVGTMGSITNIPIQITMKQDVNEQHILEFETPSERVVVSSHSVLDLIPSKTNPQRFSLVYKGNAGNKETEEYECEDVSKICKSIKNFLQRAESVRRENASLGQSTIYKKDTKAGFFKDIYSFFGN